MRATHLLPMRGDKPEWQHTQDYWTEKDAIPVIDLDGSEFVYGRAEAEREATCGGAPVVRQRTVHHVGSAAGGSHRGRGRFAVRRARRPLVSIPSRADRLD
jgi:hypothetical protein